MILANKPDREAEIVLLPFQWKTATAERISSPVTMTEIYQVYQVAIRGSADQFKMIRNFLVHMECTLHMDLSYPQKKKEKLIFFAYMQINMYSKLDITAEAVLTSTHNLCF